LPDDDPPDLPARGSSPACFLDDVAPAYAGYLTDDEVSALLAAVLAAEHAIAALGRALAARAPALATLADGLDADAKTTARELARLGVAVSDPPRFVTPIDSPASIEGVVARHRALCEHLRAVLPKIASDGLHAALNRALARHEARVGRPVSP
jgi:hypothetical protein